MVHGPWVDIYSRHDSLQKKGRQPLMTLDIFTLRDHKMRRLYILYTKFGLSAPKHRLLAPKPTLKGTHSQQAPNTNMVTHPRVTLLARRSCHDDLPDRPGQLLPRWCTTRLTSSSPQPIAQSLALQYQLGASIESPTD